ncbi:hypothetical protein PoMZ_07841 [Pyricularia oryzae]|uniref:Uncharacterized protein n=1 Tax=Pyricularia oryzae TaxID=318829 RepID=A0A4P7NG51_PYROR|nr:hypothetical protein PoMZ_07841 [Pyricularia oryzae]
MSLLKLAKAPGSRLAKLLEFGQVRGSENGGSCKLCKPLRFCSRIDLVLCILFLRIIGLCISLDLLELRRFVLILTNIDPAARVSAHRGSDLPSIVILTLITLCPILFILSILRKTLLCPLAFLLLFFPLCEEFKTLNATDLGLAKSSLLDFSAAKTHGCVLASILFPQHVGTNLAVKRKETIGSHNHTLVLTPAVLNQILKQSLVHGQVLSNTDLADRIESCSGDLCCGRLADKLIRNLDHERFKRVGRNEIMRALCQRRKERGDGWLFRSEVLGEP